MKRFFVLILFIGITLPSVAQLSLNRQEANSFMPSYTASKVRGNYGGYLEAGGAGVFYSFGLEAYAPVYYMGLIGMHAGGSFLPNGYATYNIQLKFLQLIYGYQHFAEVGLGFASYKSHDETMVFSLYYRYHEINMYPFYAKAGINYLLTPPVDYEFTYGFFPGVAVGYFLH